MAIEILEHGAYVNKCQELATLIAQHTDRNPRNPLSSFSKCRSYKLKQDF